MSGLVGMGLDWCGWGAGFAYLGIFFFGKITSHEFIENHSNLTKYLNNPRNGGVSGGPENR